MLMGSTWCVPWLVTADMRNHTGTKCFTQHRVFFHVEADMSQWVLLWPSVCGLAA